MKNNNHIHVLMPDNSLLEVSYYCEDQNATNNKTVNVIIQLDDCICKLEIEKSICKNEAQLERLVHNKVINTRGHLC